MLQCSYSSRKSEKTAIFPQNKLCIINLLLTYTKCKQIKVKKKKIFFSPYFKGVYIYNHVKWYFNYKLNCTSVLHLLLTSFLLNIFLVIFAFKIIFTKWLFLKYICNYSECFFYWLIILIKGDYIFIYQMLLYCKVNNVQTRSYPFSLNHIFQSCTHCSFGDLEGPPTLKIVSLFFCFWITAIPKLTFHLSWKYPFSSHPFPFTVSSQVFWELSAAFVMFINM